MSHTTKGLTVTRLLKHFHEGRFAIPRLQRAFVWTGQKAAKLLDSMCRGMPIGAVTIWETSKRNRYLLRSDNSLLPPYQELNGGVWFVLDGQQRLSCIYRMTQGGFFDNHARAKVDFDRVVFRVSDSDSDASRFAYRKAVENEWISVKDILSSNWKTRLGKLSPNRLKRAQACRQRLLQYQVPVVFMNSERSEDASELFVRINSAGTRVSAADRAFARALRFDLRERAGELQSKLPSEFQRLSNEVHLQTRALLDGYENVAAQTMEEVVKYWDDQFRADPKTAATKFSKKWGDQQRGTLHALDMLRSLFVVDQGCLPSQYMVSVLTVFFVSNALRPANPYHRAEIRKWFWTTALGQRYSGRGFRQNIVADARLFKQLGEGKSVKFRIVEPIDPDDIKKAAYGRRSAITDAFYCLLRSRGLASFDDGETVRPEANASYANRVHEHHIFPRRHLREDGSISFRAINSILNICLVPASSNSKFGAKPPRRYLDEYRRRRHFKTVMEKQLIPYQEASGLWHPVTSKGYAQFLRERQRLVCAAFVHAAGDGQLFRRAIAH